MPAYSAMNAMIESTMPQMRKFAYTRLPASVTHQPVPANARSAARCLETSDHEHHDGGEGKHTGSVLHPPCAGLTLHRATDSSWDRFAVLRHSLSFLTLCSLLGPTLYQWPVRFPLRLP